MLKNNKYKKLQLLKTSGKICAVDWLDITTKLGIDRNDVFNLSPLTFTAICTTYGIIVNVNDEGVAIMTEDGDNTIDATFIPLTNIIDVEEYSKVTKGKKEGKNGRR
jgi:hypothetical protein